MTRRGYKVNMATIRRKERLKWRLLNPNVSCEKKMNHQNCILINLPALPPKHCLYFILKCLLHNVNLFWKHKNLGQSDDAKRRKRGWPNKWQSVIVTETFNSSHLTLRFLLGCVVELSFFQSRWQGNNLFAMINPANRVYCEERARWKQRVRLYHPARYLLPDFPLFSMWSVHRTSKKILVNGEADKTDWFIG